MFMLDQSDFLYVYLKIKNILAPRTLGDHFYELN